MHKKGIKVVFFALFLVVIISIFVIGENENNQQNSQNNSQNNTGKNESVTQSQVNQSTKPSAEECFDIEDRRSRLKCKLQNMEEIKSMIAEKYSEFANDSSIYETCYGLKNQGLCVAFMARSLKCYGLEGEKRDRCFKVVAEFKQAKISDEISAEENETKAKEKLSNYMVLVLSNLEKRLEKEYSEGKVGDDNAAMINERIVRLKKILIESKPTKYLLRSEIKELRTIWERTVQNG